MSPEEIQNRIVEFEKSRFELFVLISHIESEIKTFKEKLETFIETLDNCYVLKEAGRRDKI